ncbi:DinB family protein [Chitiniphilus eburneus]|uniref:Damage-inducible protein DinB n=1 Tax=Chitiniphilus eburneus TaxID=2571148 RepID=A0A4U0PYT9_9NEIS|nr:DinB family protein [Chitiniphilus eburneus]TJZ73811.1 damage-inducible protein DinB [Chitiniphilus eburneus]
MNPSAARLQACYNRWMNQRLFDVCGALDDTTRRSDLGAFFKSVHGTLEHLIWADTMWLARFTAAPLPEGTSIQIDDWPALCAERQALDARIETWTDGLSESWLAAPFTFRSVMTGVERTQPGWALVIHFFNHQIHHRGQLTTLLAQLGVDFGVTDLPALPELNDASRQRW